MAKGRKQSTKNRSDTQETNASLMARWRGTSTKDVKRTIQQEELELGFIRKPRGK
ncbi:1029_t:CDS:2 [Ambispora gerdemannii]|uniref:1029_t:CDS:1 n=1 Tax=Ambispora gerdemannii TaxID=144530 RepID=A0A9N8Z5E4_9GLOM|nr:1029_t:CDS:2 [Ambispora gerdemannii]